VVPRLAPSRVGKVGQQKQSSRKLSEKKTTNKGNERGRGKGKGNMPQKSKHGAPSGRGKKENSYGKRGGEINRKRQKGAGKRLPVVKLHFL